MPRLDLKGLTLIEMLVSAIILGIALIAIMSAFFGGFIFVENIRDISIATQAAQEEMEEIRAMPFDTIKALGVSPFVAIGFSFLNGPTGTVTVDNVFGANDIRRVSVVVTWNPHQGVVFKRQLVTFITRDGLDKK